MNSERVTKDGGTMKKQKVSKIVFRICLSILGLFIGCTALLVSFFWINGVVIKPGLTYIPYKGGEFYFEGSVEDFVELYENPYLEEKVYLEFEYLGNQKEKETYEYPIWSILCADETIYSVENGSYVIKVIGRELEKVYYFLPISEKEYLTSEEKDLEEKREHNKSREVRVVLGELEKEDTVYYYQIKFPEEKEYVYEKTYGGNNELEYDVWIEGKEIPAIYLNKIETHGEVAVKRYYVYEPFSPFVGGKMAVIYTRQY